VASEDRRSRVRRAAGAPKERAGARAPAAVPRRRDEASRLQEQLETRNRELEEKTAALEAANLELRNLTQNLDKLVRQRTRALVESEAQLRRKNAELEGMNRMKTEFISIAAHELRTPMTSIVGYLDLIAESRLGEVSEDLRRPITSLRRNAHRLKRLIEEMLDVSRLDAGRVTLRRAPCSIGTIAQAVVDEFLPLASGKRQRLSAAVEPVPPIDADSDKLHQVVANLVANAIKYTHEGGEIRIVVDVAPAPAGGEALPGPARPCVRVQVRDDGIGIPAALRERIFEPFSDARTAKHHTSSGPDSAGLGLYIARGLAGLHGGTISVESVEGEGSEFTVLLPLVAPGADADPAG
jgi:signal transduction histidine kinase